MEKQYPEMDVLFKIYFEVRTRINKVLQNGILFKSFLGLEIIPVEPAKPVGGSFLPQGMCVYVFFLSFFLSFFLLKCFPFNVGGVSKCPGSLPEQSPKRIKKVSPCRQSVSLASTRCAQKTMRLSEANPKLTGGSQDRGRGNRIAFP